MAIKYHLVEISSDIVEDDYEEGEGNSTGCGLQQKVGKTFNSIEEMINYLAKVFGLPEKRSEYDTSDIGVLYTSKTVANHCDAQNGGWFEATKSEIAAWRKGLENLYAENFSIRYLHVI